MSHPEPLIYHEFITVAATPDKEVAVVINYDGTKSKSLTLTPDHARDLAVQIIAAAARAELPPKIDQRFPTTHMLPQDRASMRWAHEDDERL